MRRDRTRMFRALAWAVWLGLIPLSLMAARPKVWVDTRQDDFSTGELDGVLVSSDGEVRLALRFERVADLNEAVVWDVWREGSTLYVATGHNGRVYAVDAQTLKVEKVADLDESEAQTVAVWKGDLYIGANPGGRLYRWSPSRRAVERVWDSQESYIWDLTVWRGNLYIATGDRGRLYRVGADGKPTQVLDTEDQNLVRLWADDTGLYVGAAGLGNVYRVDPQEKAVAVYPAERAEIAAITGGLKSAGWTLALATIGTPVQTLPPGPPPPSTPPPTQPPTTVTAGSDQVTVTARVPETLQQSPQPSGEDSGTARRPPPVTFPLSLEAGFRGGAIWAMDDSLRLFPLWTTRDYWLYDVVSFQDELWVAVGSPARVISIDAQRRVRYQSSFQEEQVVRLIVQGDNLWAATSNPARLYRAVGRNPQEGTYTSPVKDAGSMARWGTLQWRGTARSARAIECWARSGNTRRPDATWTEWRGPLGPESNLDLPPSRYFQYRCTLRGSFQDSPRLQEVRVTFLPQNQPPKFAEVRVLPPGSVYREVPQAQSAARIAGAPRSTLDTRPPEPPLQDANPPPTGTPPARSPAAPSGPVYMPGQEQYKWGMQTVVWQASDPDGDDLRYDVYIQRADQTTWTLLKGGLESSVFAFDTTSLPDGWYRLRIVASDEAANAPGQGLRTETVTSLFLVDHTPPRLSLLKREKTSSGWLIRVQAQDDLSPVARAEYALQPDEWTPLFPVDQILDSRQEVLELRLSGSSAPWPSVQVRVCDSGQNCSVLSVPLTP